MSQVPLKLTGLAWLLAVGVALAETPADDTESVLFTLTPSRLVHSEELATADFDSDREGAAASELGVEEILPISACTPGIDDPGCQSNRWCGFGSSGVCGADASGCSLCGKHRCHRNCLSKCAHHGWGIARHGCCKRHCLHSTCDMYPHYAYFPEHHGYYYFRPYNYMHIFEHQQQVLQLGGDPRNPYSVSMFAPLHREFEERVPRIHEPEERVRLQEPPLPQLEDLLN
jgi:hypothetical protein